MSKRVHPSHRERDLQARVDRLEIVLEITINWIAQSAGSPLSYDAARELITMLKAEPKEPA